MLTEQMAVRVLVLSNAPHLGRQVVSVFGSSIAEIVSLATIDAAGLQDTWDLVIVDRTMLDCGLAEMLRVRQRCQLATIIVVSTRDARDSARLIDAGADDAVMTGDLSLAARLNAAARRIRTVNARRYYTVGDVVLDTATQSALCGCVRLTLSPIEASSMRELAAASPRPVSADTLILATWGVAYSSSYHQTLRVYVGYLRTKLSGSVHARIVTQRGRGYGIVTAHEPAPRALATLSAPGV